MSRPKTVLIIGGGASGMVAGIAAARNGADVTILERNKRVGRKLLATGNGRCNLSNTNIDISRYHGEHPEFIYGAFSRFGYDRTMEFFNMIGIAPKIEDEGKVFPLSGQASSVLDVLRYELDSLNVNVILDADVNKIVKKDKFEASTDDGRVFEADSVILSAGGKASPDLGSNGSGFKLAQSLGHKIIEPFPALTQLKLKYGHLKAMQGVKFDGDVSIIVKDRVVQSETGEILFTEYGISGPPIFELSRKAGEYLRNGDKVKLKLVLVNYMTEQELNEFIANRIYTGSRKSISFNFVGFLNKKLIPVILKEAGVLDINKPAGSLSLDERKRIAKLLKGWMFEVTGTNNWPSAQVTAGGVDVSEVNSKTMESKLIPGLYFSGEILDIDGDCGGFNLQWAWSSGYIAGENASLS